jgi:hypothetical protein
MAGRVLFCFTLALSALGVSGAPTTKTEYMGIPISNPGIANAIPNRYIVVYNNTFNDEDIDIHEKSVIQTIAKRNIAKRSMTGKLLSTTVDTYQIGKWRAMALEADDLMINEIFSAKEVSYIEQDARISLNARAVQGRATTGLARISHTEAGAQTYVFDDSAGEGITAFVVDTGIRVTHEEFEGRATFAANFIDDVVCRLQNLLCFSVFKGGVRSHLPRTTTSKDTVATLLALLVARPLVWPRRSTSSVSRFWVRMGQARTPVFLLGCSSLSRTPPQCASAASLS